jgi:sec-independent protein translocase protein TatC
LRKKEKKWLLLVSGFSSLLFLAGVGFAYLILPWTMKILLDAAVPIAQPMLVLDELISFVIYFTAGVGLIFQWPMAAGMLTYLNILEPKTLSNTRKYAIVGCFIICAVITADTTFVSQILLAIPMVLLYEVGVIVSKVVYLLKKKS